MKLEYIAPKINYICLEIKVSSNLKMLELNYAHISGEAFQFIFGSKGLLNVFLLTRKTNRPQSYNQPHKKFKPKSIELFVKQVWPSTQMQLYCHTLISKEKENQCKPNIPGTPSS